MTPGELIKVLRLVPAEAELVKNAVGNLAVVVLGADGDEDKYIGWVDLRQAAYHDFEKEHS